MSHLSTARELAEILDISERRVNQINSEKSIFQKDENGKFLTSQCVYSYYADKFIGNEIEKALIQEKTMHERVKREKTELTLAKMKNELHEASDVEKALTDMVITFRNKILGIPSKVSPQLIGQTNIGKIREVIDKEIRETLTELSEYDPAMFSGDGIEVEEDEPENDQTIQEDS